MCPIIHNLEDVIVTVLTDVLSTLELKGWLSSCEAVVAPWRFDFLASHDSPFHIFHAGGGYLRVEGDRAPLRVEDGDVVVFPHGHAHTIYDEPASPSTQPAIQLDYNAHSGYAISLAESEATEMILLCGAFRFDDPGDFPLLHRLPTIIHIPGEQGRMAPDLATIVRFIAHESVSQQPGAEVMLRRLTEMLFIQVVRVWIDQQAEDTDGWLAALRDQPISTALGLMQRSPERGWKVEELADAVALSRSAFSSRFTRLVGEPPMKYLTHWRMHTAKRLLKNGVPLEELAQLLGYDSGVAFRKAFKREVGMPPARYRKLG